MNNSMPELRQTSTDLVQPRSSVVARVVSTDLCTKGKSASFIRHIVIDVAGTPLEGKCTSGQSFGVVPPGTDAGGKPHHVRLYSLANGSSGEDGQPNLISTAVKRLIAERHPRHSDDDPTDHSLLLGVCSNYLCDLRPGDTVLVTGPHGIRFVLPVDTEAHDYLFIATGTGIVPFRGFCHDLLEGPRQSSANTIHLVAGSPYTTDLIYDDLFTRLTEEHPNFHYHKAISREPGEGRTSGWYVHDLMQERIDEFAQLLRNPRTLIYLCGLSGMQYGIHQLLARHGVGAGYQTLAGALLNSDPEQWTREQMKTGIRHGPRMLIEVY